MVVRLALLRGGDVMSWGYALNKVKYDVLVLLALLAYATYYYVEVYLISAKSINLLLIEPVYWILCVCVVLLIGSKVREARRLTDDEPPQACEPERLDEKVQQRRVFYRHAAWFGLTTLAYVLALDRLGFVSSSFLYVASLIFLLGARSIWLCIVLPAAVVGFLYLSMAVFLRFSLPEGIFI